MKESESSEGIIFFEDMRENGMDSMKRRIDLNSVPGSNERFYESSFHWKR